MLVQAQKATALAKAAVRNAVSNVPHAAMRSAPRGGKPAAKPTFSMANLWHLAAWASTAATALFIAIIATRSDVGSDRVSGALASLHLASPPRMALRRRCNWPARPAGKPSSHGSDIDATTRQLTQAVRVLTEDRDRLVARVAMLERNVDDITGSINRQMRRKANGAPDKRPETRPGKPSRAGGRDERGRPGRRKPSESGKPRERGEPDERAVAQRAGSGADDAGYRCRRGHAGRAAAGRHGVGAAGLAARARTHRRSCRSPPPPPTASTSAAAARPSPCAPAGLQFTPRTRSCSRAWSLSRR